MIRFKAENIAIASFADLHDDIENLHEIASDITVEINDRSLNF